MAWVAVNKDGSETIYEVKPYKYNDEWISRKDGWERPYQYFDIPQGSIKKLIGKSCLGMMSQLNLNKLEK